MLTHVNSADKTVLRRASVGSDSDLSELGAPEPSVPPRPRPVVEFQQADAPALAAGCYDDVEELLSEPLSDFRQAFERLTEQARGVVSRQAAECRALRGEVARLNGARLEEFGRFSAEGRARMAPTRDTLPGKENGVEQYMWSDGHDGREAWTETKLEAKPDLRKVRMALPDEVEDPDDVILATSGSQPEPAPESFIDIAPLEEPAAEADIGMAPSRATNFGGFLKRTFTRVTGMDDEEEESVWTYDGRRSTFGGLPTRPTRGGVFPDLDAMKAQVRQHVFSPEYNVTNYYKEQGWAQRIARSNLFEWVTLLVISLNALWIAVDVDQNTATDPTQAPILFQLMDNLFCGYFFLEWLIRFVAFKHKPHCLKDRWFMFDSMLVILTVVDTWVMALVFLYSDMSGGPGGGFTVLRVFRLLRLTRMARMMRLLRAVPELMILVRGMAAASRSVALTLVLLTAIIYTYAIILRQVTDGTAIGEQYFKTIPASMSSLLLHATLPDMSEILEDTSNAHILLGAVLLTFVLLASLTVLNMLIGVLVEVVSVVASVEREELTVNTVKTSMERIMELTGVDVDANNAISRTEFEQLLEVPTAARLINEIGVDVVGLIDYADLIFDGGQKELSFSEFFEVLLSLRGKNAATVKDIVDLRKFIYATVSATSSPQQQQHQPGVFERVTTTAEFPRIAASVKSKSAVSAGSLISDESV